MAAGVLLIFAHGHLAFSLCCRRLHTYYIMIFAEAARLVGRREAGDPKKALSFLPAEKQYLVTRNGARLALMGAAWEQLPRHPFLRRQSL